MPNTFGLAGANPQKNTKFSPVYTGRLFTGLWTNRSPLRDAASTRMEEKFYGARGDALIDGLNVEITNRLTLSRRPGNSVFDSVNTYSNVDRFYEFRKFSTTEEQIVLMIDQSNALYALYNGTKTLVWTKSLGAGPSYMQSVGNTLYFGNGTDQKKWLQTLTIWNAATKWGTPTTPFLETFIIDENGNIQQLTSAVIPLTNVVVATNLVTVTSSLSLDAVIYNGLQITFPTGLTASFLDNKTVTVTGVSGNTFTFSMVTGDYSGAETAYATVLQGGTPVSGLTEPTWSTTVPAAGNFFQGGLTYDGTVLWTNRGNPIENWGINVSGPGWGTVSPTLVGSSTSWAANTFYSQDGLLIDANNALQQVTTAGLSGSSTPAWPAAGAGVGTTTNDGTVVWTKLQTAASLVWTASQVTNPDNIPTKYLVVTSPSDSVKYLYKLQRGLANAGIVTKGTIHANFYDSGTGIESSGTFVPGSPMPSPTATATVTGLQFNPSTGNAPSTSPLVAAVVNGAGEIVNYTTPWAGATTHYGMAVYGVFTVHSAGVVNFSIGHQDGFYFGIDNGAYLQTGPAGQNLPGSNITAVNSYKIMGGNNTAGDHFEEYFVYFPAAGDYNFEFDYAHGSSSTQTLGIEVYYNICPQGLMTNNVEPKWLPWTTSLAPQKPSVLDASLDVATNFVPVSSSNLKWVNQGPISDMRWKAATNYHVGGTIIDSNSNTENPFRPGISGAVQPTWNKTLNQLTVDNTSSNLTWINKGSLIAPPGTLSAYNGGYKYTIALVNTLDDTVSNGLPLSTATGNFVAQTGVTIPAGSGLPTNLSLIDPQSDYVAIFRTTDGGSTPFLIPGNGNSVYTLKLSDYLQTGFTDTTQDVGLNNLLQAAMAGENTPPASGAINLIYHLNRIFYSIGNTVYWTSGPDAPIGNGVNGTAPLDFDVLPARVVRLVPIGTGLLAFTVSDIFLIPGDGTATYPIQRAKPFLTGIGLLNWDALDINGSIIGLFTSDNQFIVLDPSSGTTYAGFPIGDRFRKNDGFPGTTWDPSKVFVTWHVSGEDQGWYVADGRFGWYRLNPTPAPESGFAWSPFAAIVGGVRGVRSVEITPGVHRLMLGPSTEGHILYRDVDHFADDSSSYSAWAVIGSLVLAQPGQIAEVAFITTETRRVGMPLVLGIIVDEAMPFYTGPFEMLTNWTEDIPNKLESSSIYAQRFYLSDAQTETAACRHIQVRLVWQDEPEPSELLTMTIYGGYLQEI